MDDISVNGALNMTVSDLTRALGGSPFAIAGGAPGEVGAGVEESSTRVGHSSSSSNEGA